MKIQIINEDIEVVVERSLYSLDVLYKCFYWYGRDFDVSINECENECIIILKPKNETESIPDVISKIKRDLIDFKLRDIVAKETQVVRELIIAKAFAYFDESLDPTTEISDPVGFNATNI